MSGEERVVPAVADEETSPRWIRDGLRASLAELTLFGRTVIAFTLRPGQAAKDWGSGRMRAVNPLAFLATSAAMVQPVRALAAMALGLSSSGDPSLTAQVLSALGPFAHYAAVGLLCHLFLRATGRRRRASDAVGLALFAGGGPAALAEILFWGGLIVTARTVGLSSNAEMLGLGVGFSIFCLSFATSLGSLYRAGPVRVFLAFMFAFVATGLVFGALDPPGYYGMHWVVSLSLAGGKPGFSITVRM